MTSKVSEGKLERKTQGGLFECTPKEIERLAWERGRLLVAAKKALMS